MFRTLAIIAGASVVTAAAAFAGAAALGGADLVRRGWWQDDRPWDDVNTPSAGPSAQRDLTGFDSVMVAGGLTGEITVGGPFRVEVIGGDPQSVVTELDGARLTIRPRRRSWWDQPALATVRVSMPTARAVSSSAGAHVRLAGVTDGDLALDASAGAQLRASGACGALDAEASAGANLDASALTCGTGEVDVSSGAQVRVAVTGQLDVEASSGGSVYAGGTPQIGRVALSSGGQLLRD